MKEELAERQSKYEATQLQVGQAFQQKVLELDSEMLSLQEQIVEKEAKIKDQENKIELLKKEGQKVSYYETKVENLQKKLDQIALILDLDTEENEDEED
jgi:hypothetical protein